MNAVLRLVTEANPAMEEPVTQKPDKTSGEGCCAGALTFSEVLASSCLCRKETREVSCQPHGSPLA